jgi:hypothetical protein
MFRSADGTNSFAGEMVNLSLGGMCVKAQMETKVEQTWVATFSLELDSTPLSIPVQPVYARPDNQGYGGYRFVARADPRDWEEQERRIWRFLLNEQCRLRREAKQASRSAG